MINSASVKYAEVQLDGNIHFIGTQGVGKSTLLRSVLFFYNADALRLGLSKEKKSYAEYYFPYANSYVVYEVVRETGPFCVMTFKSQGKVCFRFIEGPYQRHHYINADGLAHDKWEKCRVAMDADNVAFTRKIDRFEEYRDIIYGNTQGKKEMKQFAIIESRQYQNIPRTIQNVLLNSKLEAEFIKQTIIMSLNEEDIRIDLTNYLHHLRDFEPQLADIKRFNDPRTRAASERIAELHSAIKYLNNEIDQLGNHLVWAHRKAANHQPELEKSLELHQGQLTARETQVTDMEARFQEKKEKWQKDIGIVESDIRRAHERQDYYAKLNIGDIIARIAQKPALDKERTALLNERELLTARFKEIAARFEALERDAQNRMKEQENDAQNTKLALKDDFLSMKEKLVTDYKKLIDDFNKLLDEEMKQARQVADECKNALSELRIRKEGIRHQRLYEKEIDELKEELARLRNDKNRADNQTEHLRQQVQTIQKQWETEENGRKAIYGRDRERLEEKIVRCRQHIKGIQQKIDNSKESFYGWLNEQKPGWEETIGRVCDEEILFSKNLSPALSEKAFDSFYGVDIDLNDIAKNVKTVADYQAEMATLQKEEEQYQADIAKLFDLFNDESEKIKKRYQQKIKDIKENIREQEYKSQQCATKSDTVTLRLNDLTQRAAGEKQEQMKGVDEAINKANNELLVANDNLRKAGESIKRQIKNKENERDKKIEEGQATLMAKQAEIEVTLKNLRLTHQSRLAELEQQKRKQLTNEGADTERIAAIDKRLTLIDAELIFIDQKRDTLADYNKDKRELLDRVDEFKANKNLLERQLQQEEHKHLQKKQERLTEIDELRQTLAAIQRELDWIADDLKEFHNFCKTDAFQRVAERLDEGNAGDETPKRTKQLVGELTDAYYKSINRVDELREAVNTFLGIFSSHNIFNFKTNLVERTEYLQFADELTDFVAFNKIAEFEKRFNERFADIIKLIGHDTAILVSKEGEIQRVINDINRDFKERNFAGVIKNIELRMEQSANSVVRLLLDVKKFNDEHGMGLGETNLFSRHDQQVKNQKAVELLRQMVKAIHDFRNDYISLSHTFELQFRIVENNNDTGWVEKLSNVGSDGTDVLVKAMINIMLLNVFKEGASKRFKEFRLHCMMDEIGKLHPANVRGILKFANDRNILLINGSPTENDALAYRHIYKLEKDPNSVTIVKRLITQYTKDA
ncbi:uncharacterized protein DUF3584 [Breznakibacter xylanolyticus]|uniref:Uncharacterized protein DUF3584 n=2 Tax=Breznakibacter xylanolyticus TaxID=990 RepID=A0A2W7NMI7_9BACT|nr:uncharacterized protein DUF3584 [Breznakibacter xylanolyticus]